MADFDTSQAKKDQDYILDRVDTIYKSLKEDVVDYYWEREPQDEEEDLDNSGAIRRYLRQAEERIEELLRILDRKFE